MKLSGLTQEQANALRGEERERYIAEGLQPRPRPLEPRPTVAPVPTGKGHPTVRCSRCDRTLNTPPKGEKESGYRALNDVLQERARQDAKWGEQNHDPLVYGAILTEEVGEFFQAALDTRFGGKDGGTDKVRNEAVQVAAVALAIVECLDRGKWNWGATTKTPDVQKDF